jgi:hypothetical protein
MNLRSKLPFSLSPDSIISKVTVYGLGDGQGLITGHHVQTESVPDPV